MIDNNSVWSRLKEIAGYDESEKESYKHFCLIASNEIDNSLQAGKADGAGAAAETAAAVLALYYIYVFENAELSGEIKFEAGDVSVYQSGKTSGVSELKALAYSIIAPYAKKSGFCFRVV